jgi:hypothetical protein
MKGFERMVALRGGLQDPSINRYTKRLVLWYDNSQCSSTKTNKILLTGPTSTVQLLWEPILSFQAWTFIILDHYHRPVPRMKNRRKLKVGIQADSIQLKQQAWKH